MLGIQAAGAAPLFHGAPMDHPETIATAIRIGRPASWNGAMTAMKESGGAFDVVSDEEILAAQKWLASNEGVFAEPASVTPVAALLKYFLHHQPMPEMLREKFATKMMMVLTLTGHGLKDSDAARHAIADPIVTAATMEAVLERLKAKG